MRDTPRFCVEARMLPRPQFGHHPKKGRFVMLGGTVSDFDSDGSMMSLTPTPDEAQIEERLIGAGRQL